MTNWRTEAKELGISLYHRTKEDVVKEIELRQKNVQPKMKIDISRNDAADICCKAFRAYAISKGCDPNEEILVSRWYLQMNRNRMTFIGRELVVEANL